MEQQQTEKAAKQRRFFIMLPAVALPFLIFFFWLLGRGKAREAETGEQGTAFNTNLPAVADKGQPSDKMKSYEQARQDSIKRLEAAKQDPYYSMLYGSEAGEELLYPFMPYDETEDVLSQVGFKDSNEQKVYEKLGQLNATLSQAQAADEMEMKPASTTPDPEVEGLREDITRLEDMMALMQSGSKEPDPEMQQISSVLESVLDIQHPERVQERLREQSAENLGQVFAVSPIEKKTPITLLDNKPVTDYSKEYIEQPDKRSNRFFGLNDLEDQVDANNAIEAVVHETQTVTSGSTVKLRLLNDVYINGRLIPKDNFIYGSASLQGERLEIEISGVRYDNSLFPVKLDVYDMDGISGIHIPGAISRDVAKQSGDQTIQSLNLGTFNPSIGAQAASAGIDLGRNLLSRKIKLVKVEVKAGYRVLLRDGKKREY